MRSRLPLIVLLISGITGLTGCRSSFSERLFAPITSRLDQTNTKLDSAGLARTLGDLGGLGRLAPEPTP
jgi:hypothetical protein